MMNRNGSRFVDKNLSQQNDLVGGRGNGGGEPVVNPYLPWGRSFFVTPFLKHYNRISWREAMQRSSATAHRNGKVELVPAPDRCDCLGAMHLRASG